jgi:hypothetical protein
MEREYPTAARSPVSSPSLQGCEYLIPAVDLVRTVVAAVDHNFKFILVRLPAET